MSVLTHHDRERLTELLPVLRRCVGLDPATVARLWLQEQTSTVLVRLPFGVLVSRSVAAGTGSVDGDEPAPVGSRDLTVGAEQVIDWYDGGRAAPPDNRDADWRGATPPRAGWRRLDVIGDEVIRPLVRAGALALKEAAAREGVPGAQPRAEVADALLDTVVLSVDDEAGPPAQVSLRTLSALTRMGFLPRGGTAAVDVAGRWVRVASGYGNVYESPGLSLT